MTDDDDSSADATEDLVVVGDTQGRSQEAGGNISSAVRAMPKSRATCGRLLGDRRSRVVYLLRNDRTSGAASGIPTVAL